MVWVNVDIPTKKCVIHTEQCNYAKRKTETRFKGIEELKRDGGWFSFPSLHQAESHCKRQWDPQGHTIKSGKCCPALL